jgi:hypothetical protein
LIAGLEVYDIRDPYRPKELGYFRPGALGWTRSRILIGRRRRARTDRVGFKRLGGGVARGSR